MKALLALEDGTIFHGTSFTGPGQSQGEVIFNTGMTGYQEVLTDPSYTGQMVCMTYPLIGNYGVNPEDVESETVQVEAFIVKECCKTPSNWRAKESLPEYLKRHDVMGIENIDTRALTRHLRLHGAMRAVISTESSAEELIRQAQKMPTMEGLNLVDKVTCPRPYIWTGLGTQEIDLADGSYTWPSGGPNIVVYDLGIKWNILRLLSAEKMNILVVPASCSAEQVMDLGPDGVFFSNGPGDPGVLHKIIENAAKLVDQVPVAGICLGHQILGLALGGKSFKLKFGHHGLNHPVKDLTTGKIEISSQNHGFCVDVSGLDFLEQTHINLNDNTLEGFQHTAKPVMAVQHHPEAGPGPHDSRYFFTRFREMILAH